MQQKTGEAILTFSEQDGMFLSPRGRYEINLYRQLFRIHGPKYDHKMAYEDVNNFFLLERPDASVSPHTCPLKTGPPEIDGW